MDASPRAGGLARSTAAHVAFAFLAMGGWAVFANRAHAPAAAATAGATQGAVSAIITLILKQSLEAMFARLSGLAAVVLPPLATCVVVLFVLFSVHRLAGTPEVWATIAVPYAVSSTYAWVYTASLALAARRAKPESAP